MVAPGYKIPTRQALRKKGIEYFDSQCEVIKNELTALDLRPAAVVDLWQDRCGRHYVGLSITFIDNDWKMWAITLAVKPFPESHTSENIKVWKFC